jgi:protein-disulfide isomerase
MTDSRRRAYQIGAFAICIVVLFVVLIVVLTSSSPAPLVPGKPVPGTDRTLELLAGIPQQGIALGYSGAPVTLVEFGDLQCPYCAMFAEKALPSIITRYVRSGRVRLVFRNLDGLGSDSVRAAQMAAALGKQNRLWQFVDLAYRNQGDENSGYVTNDFLESIADVIPGTDVARAMSERSSGFAQAQVTQAMRLAHQLKLKVTPSFQLFPTGQRHRSFTPTSLGSSAFLGPLQRMLASLGD